MILTSGTRQHHPTLELCQCFHNNYARLHEVDVEIRHVDLREDDVFGWCEDVSDTEYLVYIHHELDLDDYVKTLFHELVHVCQSISGLHDHKLRETEAYLLETILHKMWCDTYQGVH